MSGFRSVFAACLLATAPMACIWKRPPLDPSVPIDMVALRVDNESSDEITLYAYNASEPYRVGRVRAYSSRLFHVPERMLMAEGSLQLLVRPLEHLGYRLPIVQVGAGQKLAVTITNDPAYASVALVPPGRQR